MNPIYKDQNDVFVVNQEENKYLVLYCNEEENEDSCLCQINFQDGTIKEVGVNGVQNEHLISITKNRIEHLNEKFQCHANKMAIHHLQCALEYLELRTSDRIIRGVEGQHKL